MVTLPSQAARLSDRAHQDREIVYFPNDPAAHSFSPDHDYTESPPGVGHYFNVVRAGSTVSNPSAVLLDTDEPVTDTTQIVVISFPAVTAGQSVRLRITETYTDANRYLLDGDELVWERAFGRPRNAVVLPAYVSICSSSAFCACRRFSA